MLEEDRIVFGGVDTHRDVHVRRWLTPPGGSWSSVSSHNGRPSRL